MAKGALTFAGLIATGVVDLLQNVDRGDSIGEAADKAMAKTKENAKKLTAAEQKLKTTVKQAHTAAKARVGDFLSDLEEIRGGK